MKQVPQSSYLLILCLFLTLTTGCLKQEEQKKLPPIEHTISSLETKTTKKVRKNNNVAKKSEKTHIARSTIINKDRKKITDLSFEVENVTGKTLYITCFSHIRRNIGTQWHWIKSPIYTTDHNQTVTVEIPKVAYEPDNQHVFGVLGVFDTEEAALDATYELLQDTNRIDLDVLHKLKNKKVTINVEQYGFKKPFLDYDFISLENKDKKSPPPELDFYVLNNTHKPIIICGFAYLKKAKGTWIRAKEKDDMDVWRYDKTKVLKLQPGEYGYIDIDTITSSRDREYVIGYLAVFEEHEQTLAEEATYELVSQKRKITVGNLKDFNNGLVVIEISQYGIMPDVIEYAVKPARKINISKLVK